METYKFDWKDTVTGTIEIEASSRKEAEEKFKNIPSEELYKQSKWNSDRNYVVLEKEIDYDENARLWIARLKQEDDFQSTHSFDENGNYRE